MIKFNEALRDSLKKPLGKLVEGTQDELAHFLKRELKKYENIITVGDIISYEVLRAGFSPKMAIFDHKTVRGPVSDEIKSVLDAYNADVYYVENRAGSLSEKAFNTIKMGFDCQNNIKIIVDGEEDLFTLPAIIDSPLRSCVLYGQPDVGVVIVTVDEEKKQEINKILQEAKKWK